MKNTVKYPALCAFFAAATAVLSQIAIPIGPVPINLATFSVLCAGGLLGAKYGALSQVIYLLLGLAGAPVFASFTSGIGRLAGPTGGYIIGYVAAAWVTGFLIGRFGTGRIAVVLSMFAGVAVYMPLGTLWYMYNTGAGFAAAMMTCVVPFLPGDAVKIGLASIIVCRLRSVLLT